MDGDKPAAGEAGHFWRPSTRLNRLVERVLRVFPERPLRQAELELLQHRSIDAFAQLGASRDALERVVTDTEWQMSPGRAPSDAWGGEVLRRADGPPYVVLYRDSALTRLPGRWLFRAASQLTVDHMFGHLYEYHCGAEDWGEEVATRWQFRALRQRGGVVNNATAAVMALTSRFHKQIPLSNYG